MKQTVKFLIMLYAGSAFGVQFGGGGSVLPEAHDEVSEFEQMNRWYRYWQDRQRLESEGLLVEPIRGANHALYDFPLRTTENYPGFHGVSNFVDLNPSFPGSIQDYNCGTRSYDLDNGYNHQGIDFFTWPYEWYKMDNNEVEVIAAEAGTITSKIDGNYDRSCGFNDPNNTGWNAVYVTHSDGSYAWYGHLKSGSLTSKPVGSTVAIGEYLGVVGSSGNSTGPHLHFETYDSLNHIVEPYFGSCNGTTSDSWWRSQLPYYDSGINQLITHANAPFFGSCPGIGQTPDSENSFVSLDVVYLAAYYRDQLSSQTSQYEVLMPNGAVYASWNHNSNAAHYAASYWYWTINLPAQAMAGQWTFRVTFEGQVEEQHFGVNDVIFINSFD